MTVLIDSAVWQARGRYFCHMASDHSLQELHQFATRLGLPRRAFHRDHYDLPETAQHDALQLGATRVDSATLVRRITAAGLRRRQADTAAPD